MLIELAHQTHLVGDTDAKLVVVTSLCCPPNATKMNSNDEIVSCLVNCKPRTTSDDVRLRTVAHPHIECVVVDVRVQDGEFARLLIVAFPS